MAQTKRKRRTKHRGTPAGTIETRGRTGRRPTAAEGRQKSKDDIRRERMMRPPTWNGAALRAAVAASLLFLFTQLGVGADLPLGQSIAVSVFAMLFYLPLGYYTDRFMWRRRMARMQTQKDERAAKST